MSNEALHIAGTLLARSASGRLDPESRDGKMFHEHLAQCASCQARYENMKRIVARMPEALGAPELYPEPEPVCDRAAQLEIYDELPLTAKLTLWAHVVYGSCPECAFFAKRMGDAFHWNLDPFTEHLVNTLGKLAPRRETPRFEFAMAGPEAPQRGRPVAMHTAVYLSERAAEKEYGVSVCGNEPAERGGLWHLTVDVWGDALPAGFHVSLYREGCSEVPLYTSSRSSMTVDLPDGIYRLNIFNQDQIALTLLEGMQIADGLNPEK